MDQSFEDKGCLLRIDNFFHEKQKRDSFLFHTILALLTGSNYLGPHKEKPVGLVFTIAVSGSGISGKVRLGWVGLG